MQQAKIVIVEDESIVALDIRNRLNRLGYTVLGMAATGEDAVKMVGATQPDIVLMDIHLRGKMDGVEAAARINEQHNIPVVYLTAYADETTLQRAKITESFGYLLKPFEERELSATIETALYKHHIESRLKEHDRWLSTTLKSIGDAVIATDVNGVINFFNPIAEQLTGWPQDEAISKPVSRVIHLLDEIGDHDYSDIAELVLTHKQNFSLSDQVSLVSRQGHKTPIDASAALIEDERHNVSGVVLVFKDVSRRRETELQLRNYTTELQAQNAELDAFAHTVAHDLQNPLGNIVSMADALRMYHKSLTPNELTQYLNHIVQNGLRMSNIIDSILLLAGIRRRENVPRVPLSMDKIIEEVKERLAQTLLSNNAQLILPDQWPVALGYAPWIEEVWANYISNGIKYGGSQPVLQLGADLLADNTIRFWIRDNGIGIDPEEQAELFTPFTKLNQIQTKGQGLGLSIVRRIIEKLGGTVGAESSGLNQGSIFYFTLPRAAESAESDNPPAGDV